MKPRMRHPFLTGLFCVLLSLPLGAQEDELKGLPGYVDFGDLSATYGEPKITINLGGAMLNFVGMMSSPESPETAELISKLKGIRVQVYETGSSPDAARSQYTRVRDTLKSSGWEPVVQVNEVGEQVLVYLKLDSGGMEGMTVMVIDGREAVFVNVIGQLSPAELAKVMKSLDVDVDLDLN